jgi:hypothetical protein
MAVLSYLFAWCANPFWGLGMILALLHKPKTAMVIGIIAVLFACTTFLAIGQQFPGDEGGITHNVISHLSVGFYFWMASLLVLPVSIYFQKPT